MKTNDTCAKLLSEISQLILDDNYAKSANPDLYRQRMLLQTEFDNLSTTQTERMMLKQVFHEHGEKAGKLLTNQLQQLAASSAILEISRGPGTTTFDPQIINKQFEQYYSNLYSSEVIADTSLMHSFLDKLKIPSLSLDDCWETVFMY